jgi:hypothetical protein
MCILWRFYQTGKLISFSMTPLQRMPSALHHQKQLRNLFSTSLDRNHITGIGQAHKKKVATL